MHAILGLAESLLEHHCLPFHFGVGRVGAAIAGAVFGSHVLGVVWSCLSRTRLGEGARGTGEMSAVSEISLLGWAWMFRGRLQVQDRGC